MTGHSVDVNKMGWAGAQRGWTLALCESEGEGDGAGPASSNAIWGMSAGGGS